VAGTFSSAPYAGLFFYDQVTTDAEIYSTDGNGQITSRNSRACRHGGQAGPTWCSESSATRHSLPCSFIYDRPKGVAAIYEVDGNAHLNLLRQYSGWPSSWDEVTTVRVPVSKYTGIVLYDRAAGRGEILQCTGSGERDTKRLAIAARHRRIVHSDGKRLVDMRQSTRAGRPVRVLDPFSQLAEKEGRKSAP
jgi:hypothetical protein